MSKISLAKALKVKNRIAGQMSQMKSRLQSSNSIEWIVGDDKVERVYNPVDMEADITLMKSKLIKLKTAICNANATAGIYQLLAENEESKALMEMWSHMSTDDGKKTVMPNRYFGGDEQPKVVIHEAVFKESDVVLRREGLQRLIEDNQDKIDEINASTHIELDFEV
jgi:hypothetical protein